MTHSSRPKPTRVWQLWRRIRTILTRFGKCVLVAAFFYLVLILAGLIPVNGDFTTPDNGIEIFAYSSSVHSDIIVPIKTSEHDWGNHFDPGNFNTIPKTVTHIAFGWGDRGFYIDTPTWGDLKISTAGRALLVPSETVMHVQYVTRPQADQNMRSVRISPSQYKNLTTYILDSFARDEGEKIQPIADASYGPTDAFFKAQGRYHIFRTCNCWTGNGLKAAGVKVGWFTPLPRTVFLYLPTT